MANNQVAGTPFALLLQDYMWGCRPPLNAHKLAHRLGIGRQTVYNWLNAGTIPQATMLPNVTRVTAIPLTTLYEACGYPIPAAVSPSTSPTPAPTTYEVVDPRLFDILISAVEADPAYAPQDRKRLIEHARAMKDAWLALHPEASSSQDIAGPWLRPL